MSTTTISSVAQPAAQQTQGTIPNYSYISQPSSIGVGSLTNSLTSAGCDYDMFMPTSRVELKLTDGTKVVDTFQPYRVYDIRQHTGAGAGPQNVCTSFRYMMTPGQRNMAIDMKYDVDCSLSDLCFLLGIEFKPFSLAIMERAVKNG